MGSFVRLWERPCTNSARIGIVHLPENWYFSRAATRPTNNAYASELLSFFIASGLDARVFDFWLTPKLSIDEITSYDPDFIVVVDHQPNAVSRFIGRFTYNLKQANNELPVLLYGTAQAYAETVLRSQICDYVVLGDEPTFLALFDFVREGQGERVNGIAYLRDNDVVVNLPVPYLYDLDTLPLPIPYHLQGELDHSEYLTRGNAVMELITSRGCYADCSFCHVNTDRKLVKDYRWRAFSAGKVVDMFKRLSSENGIRYFNLRDLDFVGTSPERAVEIAQGILSKGLNIRFSVYSRASDVVRVQENLNLLHRAGLVQWFVGLESFENSTLRMYRKGVNVSDNLLAVQSLLASGITVATGFIALTPETTLDQFEFSLRKAIELVSPQPHMFRSVNYFLDGFMSYYDHSPPYFDYAARYGTIVSSELKAEIFALREIRQYNWPHTRPLPSFSDKRAVVAAALTKIIAHEMLKKAIHVAVRLSDMVALKQKREIGKLLQWEIALNSFQLELGLDVIKSLRRYLEQGDSLNNSFDKLLIEIFDSIRSYNKSYLPEDLVEPTTRDEYNRYFQIIG